MRTEWRWYRAFTALMKWRESPFLCSPCHKYLWDSDGKAALTSKPIIATVEVAVVVAQVRRAMASSSMTLSVMDRPATNPLWMSRVTFGRKDFNLPLSAELKDLASVLDRVSGLVWSAVRVVVEVVSVALVPLGRKAMRAWLKVCGVLVCLCLSVL